MPQLLDIKKGAKKKKILFNRKAFRKEGMRVKTAHNVQYISRQCRVKFFLEASEMEFFLPFSYE